jgi:transposase-like protein
MKRRIRKELLDELLADYRGPEDMTGPDGLLKQLTGALVERVLAAELTDHLGHEPGAPVQRHPVLRDKATPSLAHPPSGEQRFGLRLTV